MSISGDTNVETQRFHQSQSSDAWFRMHWSRISYGLTTIGTQLDFSSANRRPFQDNVVDTRGLFQIRFNVWTLTAVKSSCIDRRVPLRIRRERRTSSRIERYRNVTITTDSWTCVVPGVCDDVVLGEPFSVVCSLRTGSWWAISMSMSWMFKCSWLRMKLTTVCWQFPFKTGKPLMRTLFLLLYTVHYR